MSNFGKFWYLLFQIWITIFKMLGVYVDMKKRTIVFICLVLIVGGSLFFLIGKSKTGENDLPQEEDVSSYDHYTSVASLTNDPVDTSDYEVVDVLSADIFNAGRIYLVKNTSDKPLIYVLNVLSTSGEVIAMGETKGVSPGDVVPIYVYCAENASDSYIVDAYEVEGQMCSADTDFECNLDKSNLRIDISARGDRDCDMELSYYVVCYDNVGSPLYMISDTFVGYDEKFYVTDVDVAEVKIYGVGYYAED